jgi:arylsulfatase A-like enzyme
VAIAIGCIAGCSWFQSKPNVLFIFLDDQPPDSLGFEGNDVVRTPNIDRLAREGTYFSRAYVPLPQCAPSRAAVLTGRYPHETGVMTSRGHLAPHLATFATALEEAGYRRGFIGKWDLGAPNRPQGGFDDFWVTLDTRVLGAPRYFDPPLWLGSNSTPHEGHLPRILTDYAVEFIDRPDERPFLLWLSYLTPHPPYDPPSVGEPTYEPLEMPLPESVADDLLEKPRAQRESLCHEWFVKAGPARVQVEIADYYAMLSALDSQIGRLVGHLEARGRRNDTLIVFMSDNGVFLGQHQMLRKGPMFYEELVRVPLIFHWPGVVPAGERRTDLVSSLDLLPTFTELGGAPVPRGLAGRSIWPQVLERGDPVRDEIFLEYRTKSMGMEREPMLGVVTARHKYVRYLEDGDEELYDLVVDPLEMKNLVRSEAHAEALAQLRARVDRFRETVVAPFW